MNRKNNFAQLKELVSKNLVEAKRYVEETEAILVCLRVLIRNANAENAAAARKIKEIEPPSEVPFCSNAAEPKRRGRPRKISTPHIDDADELPHVEFNNKLTIEEDSKSVPPVQSKRTKK